MSHEPLSLLKFMKRLQINWELDHRYSRPEVVLETKGSTIDIVNTQKMYL